MPVLNWIGKDAVVNHDKEVAFRLLKKVKSVSLGESSQNLIIHGDNLEALKALIPFYYEKIKCIYIDPPYNTGNENWVYNDNVNSPKIKRWFRQVVDRDDLCRHDKWLCMMYPRLKLMRDLLSHDGVIFISIDDNEFSSLKLLCDEVFGEDNILGIFTWIRKKKGSNLSKTFRKITEYVLCYQASQGVDELYGQTAYLEKQVPLLNRANRENIIEFPRNKIIMGNGFKANMVRKGSFGNGELTVELLNDIFIQNRVISNKFKLKGRFRWSQSTINYEIENGSIFTISKTFRINVARFNQSEKSKSPSSLLSPDEGIGSNEDATAELRKLFPNSEKLIFDYPKPVSLIKYLVASVTRKDKKALILDSMAGSGTTGHAILDLNKEDGGNRKFILVEMEDAVAKDITAERVKRAIINYKYNDGFEYCELDKPLFDDQGKIDETCNFEQLAAYIYFTETQTNIDPKKIKDNFIGGFEGIQYHLIYKGKDKNDLNKTFLRTLKKDGTKKVIYADRCLIDEDYLTKLNITFKQIPYQVKVY